MKKYFIALSLVLVLLFCCSCKSQDVPLIVSNISFSADISYYNEKYLGSCVLDDNGKMVLTLTSPEDLKGLTLTYSGDDVTAEYMGISYTPKSGNMPVGSAAECLYTMIRNVAEDIETAPSKDGNCSVEGEYCGKKYIFNFSPVGLPLELSSPDNSFKIIFSDVLVK